MIVLFYDKILNECEFAWMNEKAIAHTVVLIADDGIHLLQPVSHMVEKQIIMDFHHFFQFGFNGVEKCFANHDGFVVF